MRNARRLLATVGPLSAWLVGMLFLAVMSWQVAQLLNALAGPDLNVGR